MKRMKFLFVGILVLFLLVGCNNASSENNESNESNEGSNQPIAKVDNGGKNPIVTIEMENGQEIKIELYPDIAPNTVYNFISLVNDGFYDGTIFHRVIPEFMIQGGDPNGNGTGGPGYSIKGEFSANGFENDLQHDRGVVSMARSSNPDSAGSQFFIMVENSPYLDREYAAFGKVIEGIEVADEIVAVETKNDKPLEDQVMKKVTVETFGVEYPEPVKVE